MAHAHAKAFQAIEGVTLAGVVEPDPDRRAEFATAYDIADSFASVEDAIAACDFEAAANVTPDPIHYPTTMPLLAAGKHVLCEKPLALTHADAAAMGRAARAAGVVNMVNLTYRREASLARAADMVAEGRIGEVRHFDAAYLQSWLTQPAWGDWHTSDTWLWRLSVAHGFNGVLGDVGIHILDFLTHIAGQQVTALSCRLKTFDKAPGNRIGDYDLDANDSCAMTATLSGGALGVVHASRFATGHINDLRLRIHGTEGALDVRSTHHESRLTACLGNDLETGRWRNVRTEPPPSNFETFIAAVRGECPGAPDFATGERLQKLLDLAVQSDAEGGRSLQVQSG